MSGQCVSLLFLNFDNLNRWNLDSIFVDRVIRPRRFPDCDTRRTVGVLGWPPRNELRLVEEFLGTKNFLIASLHKQPLLLNCIERWTFQRRYHYWLILHYFQGPREHPWMLGMRLQSNFVAREEHQYCWVKPRYGMKRGPWLIVTNYYVRHPVRFRRYVERFVLCHDSRLLSVVFWVLMSSSSNGTEQLTVIIAVIVYIFTLSARTRSNNLFAMHNLASHKSFRSESTCQIEFIEEQSLLFPYISQIYEK